MASKQQKKKGEVVDIKSSSLERPAAMPVRPLTPFDEIDRMMRNFMFGEWMRPYRFRWPARPEFGMEYETVSPNIDVINRDREIVVRVEMPGVSKKDIELSVTDDTVSFRAVRLQREEKKEDEYYRCEMTRGEMHRMIRLPARVESRNAKARLEDGVLEITLPKSEGNRRRTVKIS